MSHIEIELNCCSLKCLTLLQESGWFPMLAHTDECENSARKTSFNQEFGKIGWKIGFLGGVDLYACVRKHWRSALACYLKNPIICIGTWLRCSFSWTGMKSQFFPQVWLLSEYLNCDKLCNSNLHIKEFNMYRVNENKNLLIILLKWNEVKKC